MQHVERGVAEAESPGPGPGAGPALGLGLGDPALAVAAATALALALYVWGMWRFDRFAARAIPFAPARPFVGAALPFLLRQRTFAQHLQALYRSGRARPLLGVFHLRAPAFLLRDPRLLRRVLVADAAEFPRRCAPPPLSRPAHPLLDKQLDLLPGRRWRRVREVLGAALAPARLEPQLPEVAACALRLAQRLELSGASGEAVEVRAPLEAFWSEALGRALLGRRSRALADARDALHRQRRALLAAAAPAPRTLLLARCPALAQLLRIHPVPPSVEKYFLELADQTATDVIQSASTEKGDVRQCTKSNSEELIKRTSALWYMISTYLFDVDIHKQDVDKESRSRRDKTEAAQPTTMQLSPEMANQGKSRPARKSVTFAPDTELIVSTDATTPSSPSNAPNEHPGLQIPILNVPCASANDTKVDEKNLTSSTAVTTPGEETNTIKIETTPTQKTNNFEKTLSANTSTKEIPATDGDIFKSNVAVAESHSQIRDLTIPVVVISAADVQESVVESTEAVNSLHVKNENQEQTESETSHVSSSISDQSLSKDAIETITHSSSINNGNTPLSCPETAIEAGTTDLVQNTMILNNKTDTVPSSTMPTTFTQKASLHLQEKGNLFAGNIHDTNDASKVPEVSKSSELSYCKNQEQGDLSESPYVVPPINENLQNDSKETAAEPSQLSQVAPESVLDSKEEPTTQEGCKVDQAPMTEQGSEREKQEHHKHLEAGCEKKASAEIPENEQNAKAKISEEKETNQPPLTLQESQMAHASIEGERQKGARAAAAEAGAQLAAQAAEGGRRAALAVALALRLLGRHPEAQARAAADAREAWRRLVGHDDDDTAAQRPLTAALLDDAAPYLDAVLAETLRLHPPCPLVTRACRGRRGGGALRAQGAGLRVEVALGPRDALWVPVGALQRDARHWRDPDAFRPERFLGDARARYADHAAFLPFGLGPRACAGRELVLQYAKLALMAVLARLEVEAGGARGPREARWRVAMEVEGGVRLKLRPRALAHPPHA
ncbi:hypothetical protein R5R35_010768 [Gryllus longicercus]|uniref:Cytochrome P450 n=1 Tax=Gryllus longicercus TaxID=2509291 RepID=A0AAN9VDW4_9ORTH